MSHDINITTLKLNACFKPLYNLSNLGVNDLRLEVLKAVLMYWNV
jgi:hypothetical protein